MEEGSAQGGGDCEYRPRPDCPGALHKVHPVEGTRRLGAAGEWLPLVCTYSSVSLNVLNFLTCRWWNSVPVFNWTSAKSQPGIFTSVI